MAGLKIQTVIKCVKKIYWIICGLICFLTCITSCLKLCYEINFSSDNITVEGQVTYYILLMNNARITSEETVQFEKHILQMIYVSMHEQKNKIKN